MMVSKVLRMSANVDAGKSTAGRKGKSVSAFKCLPPRGQIPAHSLMEGSWHFLSATKWLVGLPWCLVVSTGAQSWSLM